MSSFFNPREWVENNKIHTTNIDLLTEPLSTSKLKKVLDHLFRQKMLESVSVSFTCPLTGKRTNYKDIQVCHRIDRACMELRWDTDNCILCSKNSNFWDSKENVSDTDKFYSRHHRDFDEYLGEEKVNELLMRKENSKPFTRIDYINKLKELL